MNINTNIVRRASFGVAALVVSLAGFVPVFNPFVSADQVSTRSIQMSDATPSHTNTSYRMQLTPATTGAQSIVIDFCSESSIIGGTCTAPAGFDAKTSITFTSNTSPTTGWAVSTAPSFLSSRTNGVALNKGSGSALTTAAIDVTLSGITNPSTTGTFWARVYTYSDATYGSSGTVYASPSSIGSNVDYGGFAMSTTSLINISATVMETLTFCVNQSQPGNGCTSLTSPVNLVLGHGTPRVLDSSVVDTDTAYFQISTNALNGAIVAMKSHNTCSGLSRNGGTDLCPIPGIGTTNTIPGSTADFGVHLTTVTGGTGTVNAKTDYDGNGGNASKYGMNSGVTSTYGDPIADTNSTATANVNSQMTFAAQASVTTPAGVYVANESLIATGTF